MNTRVSYRYADRNNCRQYTSFVVAGVVSWEQIAPYLLKQHSFIPGQVGLEDLQYRFALPGADHPWHQMIPEDFRPTDVEPTTALTAAELIERFRDAEWDASRRGAPTAVKLPEPLPPIEETIPAVPYRPSNWPRSTTPRTRKPSARTK
ncbi:MAG: hypothetical protein Fur005_10270 [Roseiflexaceae bacterium]